LLRGFSVVSLEAKGRVAIPSRFRARLYEQADGVLILTINPLDRCLWLYPLPEWEVIEHKLAHLSDFEPHSRRTKQMMRGHAMECECDNGGRILIPQGLRDYARLQKQVVFLGQGNKCELWDEALWEQQRQQWLRELGEHAGEPVEGLRTLTL